MKKLFFLMIGLFLGLSIYAAPYYNERMTLMQPDGSEVEVILNGDEYFMHAESPDGYTLILDPVSFWICYAKVAEDGKELVSSGIKYSGPQTKSSNGLQALKSSGIPTKLKYGKEQINKIVAKNKQQLQGESKTGLKSSEAVSATLGTITQVVILIDFPDRTANISKTEIENAYNGDNYNSSRGSVKNWAWIMSNNKVTLNTKVIGYYRAPNNTSSYISSSYNFTSLRNSALAWADARFDFSTLTSENGIITSINFLYTGNVIGTWANSLWPHAGGSNYRTNDGVRTGSYFLSNLGNNTPISRLRTIRHELGHSVFKWPDTYDYQGDSYSGGGFAMETDIPCAPFRAQHGYIDVININGKNQTYSLNQWANTALKYTNPNNSKEYFMIEYLRKVAWRSNAPDEGLLIWHVDEDGNNSHQDMTASRHYRHSVEQADGLFELERHIRNGSDGDLFHGGYKTSFTNSTTPNSKWWNGSRSGLVITNIGNKGGDNMSITVGSGSCSPTAITPYYQINTNGWTRSTSATLEVGDKIWFGPQPIGGNWSWTGPNGFTSSRRDPTISNIQTNQAGNYIARYTNGCGARSTKTFTITVNSACPATPINPYVQVKDGIWQNTSRVTINSGDKLKLGPQPIRGNWSWSGLGTSGSSREQTIYPTASGTARATYTNSCGTRTTRNFVITIDNSAPSGYTYSCNENQTVQVNGTMNIAYGANGAFYYKYNITSNLPCNNSTFGDPIRGTVKKCYTQFISNAPVEMAPEMAKSDIGTFKIYPNPVDNNTLYLESNFADKAMVRIFNIEGKELYSNELNEQVLEISTSSFNSGIYFLHVQFDDRIETQKFMIK